ncbi:hypothetical protein M128_1460 [Bacteroides fragilis str. S6L8]|uniref:Uncharacterized protein n=1 Tax=Bacteroides fragilis str. S36L11 TaxID=1339327 RepID=A0A016ALZ7_BACFG|nr:hypothetical protein M074_1431 [Bacteroides fragilis str. DS-166]EXZ29386.1 hypothetical protein M136_1421 [Bacteroides fragilis str. S36L11]EYA05459.1 hypothetical protein M126_1600 [Bacteroides fragilis str. S6L3]EYA10344.1 hypothetical protein M130_1392 [Bacteroides fragilis str. S6R6]EYB01260.1 hypothetical protein M128_1460 [Bacteroides fragilis str. S6L8]EYB05918.1 hypothetical protein M129_1333 [Bacteroides fragilis str. S6R5]EYE54648.1 hypothetical protein M127_1408 [Bacteroides fr
MATPRSWSFLAGLTIGYRKKGVLLCYETVQGVHYRTPSFFFFP